MYNDHQWHIFHAQFRECWSVGSDDKGDKSYEQKENFAFYKKIKKWDLKCFQIFTLNFLIVE